METCEHQISLSFEGELLCSAQGCHASQVPLPGRAEEKQMTVGSGQQCSMLLNQSSPLGVFSKILLGSSRWTSSEEFSYVWNRLDTRFALSAFQLTPLGQSIEGNECSLWRTPNASDVTGGPMDGEQRLAQGHHLNLCEQAATPKLWPTPRKEGYDSQGSQGSLNPRFVEQLQGFPIDHTALKRSVTQLSRSKRTRSSKRLRK
jgi:hypothetical protein